MLLATSCALFYGQKAARVCGEAWQALPELCWQPPAGAGDAARSSVHAACTVCACSVHGACIKCTGWVCIQAARVLGHCAGCSHGMCVCTGCVQTGLHCVHARGCTLRVVLCAHRAVCRCLGLHDAPKRATPAPGKCPGGQCSESALLCSPAPSPCCTTWGLLEGTRWGAMNPAGPELIPVLVGDEPPGTGLQGARGWVGRDGASTRGPLVPAPEEKSLPEPAGSPPWSSGSLPPAACLAAASL